VVVPSTRRLNRAEQQVLEQRVPRQIQARGPSYGVGTYLGILSKEEDNSLDLIVARYMT
jgi:hypothetical protein